MYNVIRARKNYDKRGITSMKNEVAALSMSALSLLSEMFHRTWKLMKFVDISGYLKIPQSSFHCSLLTIMMVQNGPNSPENRNFRTFDRFRLIIEERRHSNPWKYPVTLREAVIVTTHLVLTVTIKMIDDWSLRFEQLFRHFPWATTHFDILSLEIVRWICGWF
jgi:hypothetical protein